MELLSMEPRKGYLLAMYCFNIAAIAGAIAGTTFISTPEEGILKAVPDITTSLQHDPSPLQDIASADQVKAFFSGPCVNGYTRSPPWWKVDLGREMKVNQVTVKNIGSCCHPWLGNFSVHVGSRMSGDDRLYGHQKCLSFGGSLDKGTHFSGPCETPVTGRYVHLTSKCVDMFGTLLSCELEVHSVTAEPPQRQSAVFSAQENTDDDGERVIACARQCLRDTSCVRFNLSASLECQLYDTGPDGNPDSYSLYRITN